MYFSSHDVWYNKDEREREREIFLIERSNMTNETKNNTCDCDS